MSCCLDGFPKQSALRKKSCKLAKMRMRMRMRMMMRWMYLPNLLILPSLLLLLQVVDAANLFSSNVVVLTATNWQDEVVNSPHAVFVNICRSG
jgi:hypothetical protein